MRFEWDPEKAARNEQVHGVSFDEATELFTTDQPVLEVYDADHSTTEDRFKFDRPGTAWPRARHLDGTRR